MSVRNLLTAFALLHGIASGAQYYVSTTGSDSAPGTIAQPWRSVQMAVNTAAAGDTVFIRGGSYAERVTIGGLHGTAAQRITFTNYAGEFPVIEQPGVTPPAGTSALLWIANSDFITVQGIEFRNYATASDQIIVAGIYINGACSGLQILQNMVHDIQQNNTTRFDTNANAFGIAVYGDAATAVDGLVLDSNQVYNLRTGASESVTLNGNVTNFTVTNNVIHDNNNNGIDFIGFEGTNANAALDQARNGECSGNVVYNIDSAFNPAYGGSFNASPPNDNYRGATGIYVDGGASITIERNLVYQCNLGIEAGSEHSGKNASAVTVRDNILHHNHVGGLIMGGAASGKGGTLNCNFTNNTLYLNDTSAYGGGQVSIQHHVSGCIIQGNIIVGNPSTLQFVLKSSTDGTFAANAINWNLYSGATPTNVDFIWANVDRNTFSAWQSASGQDANSFFTATASTQSFSNAASNDFTLFATSPAVNAGDTAFVAASGEKDFAGRSRIAAGRVDLGAYEYMTPYEAWRDLYFGLPDGGTGANGTDDPDHDGITNLMEYALNANPLVPFTGAQPAVGLSAGHLTLTFTRNLNASDLTFTIEASNDLVAWSSIASKAGTASWTTNAGVTVSDPGSGNVIVTDSANASPGTQRFLRLKVTQ